MKKTERYLGPIIGFVIGSLFFILLVNQPDPEVVEVQHVAVRDSIVGHIDTLDIIQAPKVFFGRTRKAKDVIALNWQYFKTDTMVGHSPTPHSVYDDIILVRRFYYRGGSR